MRKALKDNLLVIVLIIVSYVLMCVAIATNDYAIGCIALMAMFNVNR